MGMKVEMQMGPDPSLLLARELHAGLIEAGHVILALSDSKAPTEEVPKHGTHMAETGFVVHTLDAEGDDAAVIGYGAFWAVIVEEDMDAHHEHGAAKFLELGAIEGAPAAFGILAVAAGKGLGL